ncbi:MAG TPA: winged helix-turn-helix transcriptional regulator [Solirubrobacteraceae bacterium]|jgi:DNA-binding HxlR family transcriptional regulator|nr:winged helix-turn-helix transcriptional regulator [Solirubrobacteraceae bacterium]
MRSYNQYCAVAKGLDVIGDRWTLLIVRELLLRGACRYTDLRNGLPAIATNLLAERLRQLEKAGIVSREEAPPPIATTLFDLTERGAELRPVLQALQRWGLPYMTEGPAPADEFRSRWTAWPAELSLTDREPDAGPITLRLLTGDEPMIVRARDGAVTCTPGDSDSADATIAGTPPLVLGLLTGALDLPTARSRGLDYQGDVRAFERLRPEPRTV